MSSAALEALGAARTGTSLGAGRAGPALAALRGVDLAGAAAALVAGLDAFCAWGFGVVSAAGFTVRAEVTAEDGFAGRLASPASTARAAGGVRAAVWVESRKRDTATASEAA